MKHLFHTDEEWSPSYIKGEGKKEKKNTTISVMYLFTK